MADKKIQRRVYYAANVATILPPNDGKINSNNNQEDTMSTNTNNEPSKFTRFLRNHAALLLLIFSVIAIATVVLAVTLSGDSLPDAPVDVKPNPDVDNPDDKPTPTEPEKVFVKVYFAAPLAYQSVGMEYSDGKDVLFVFNKTLNTWAAHKAVDLVAEEGTKVSSMYDGTVVDVSESYGMGNIVKIDHGDNVVVTYASLSDVKVTKGQTVSKGDQIGSVSTSAGYEFGDGAHLHLEVAKDGKSVDPMPYVKGEIFREVEQKQ